MAWEEIDMGALPKNWDWRNINGTSYVSWSRNQHIPVYCGSCWAHGTTSALADRFNILLKDHNPTPVGLNPQVMVNCQAGGDCGGGDPSGVYDYAYQFGIPDSSCEQYVARDLDSPTCHPIDVCRDCHGPPPPEGDSGIKNCWAVTNYKKYYASEYYSVSGPDEMKAELFKNGPIGCGIDATDGFEAYEGGIYSERNDWSMINHEISVLGYGFDEDTQTEYWIGRNSWGTYWGEHGFFRIKMYEDNLAIEDDCIAAIPSFQPNTAEDFFSQFM
jgi:cathepsin X